MVDWVGLDIKALVEDYPSLTGVTNSGESAWRSARLLAASGVAHEIRTTLYPAIDNPCYRNRLQGNSCARARSIIDGSPIDKCLGMTRPADWGSARLVPANNFTCDCLHGNFCIDIRLDVTSPSQEKYTPYAAFLMG